MTHRRTVPAVALVLAAMLLGGCTREIAGVAGPLTRLDPRTVAGLPVVEGPSGPREGVVDASLPVEDSDGSAIDRLATNAVADVQTYWQQRFEVDFDRRFEPLDRLVSYNSGAAAMEICATGTEGLVNAFYCQAEDTIAWDRGELLPALRDSFGPLAVVMVLAHEMGHAVQHRLELADPSTPTIVSEQQADCFTGAFVRHVAEGGSEHFQVSTGQGLSGVLASLFSLRDPVGGVLVAPNAHGTAFDRVAAFQFGFADGPRRCVRIDMPEVQRRATQFGFANSDDAATEGNLEITERNVRVIEQSLRTAFGSTGAQPPDLSFGTGTCPGVEATSPATSPATYCPEADTIALELDGLAAIGTPPSSGGGGIGDFAAFALIASRYVLSVQQAVGLPPDDERAGLRTACLVGAWAGVLIESPFGNRNPIDDPPLRISSGDLDEAVSELLAGGLIAGDVNGVSVPSGFARVDAFRIGFLEGSGQCAPRL
ncbi:MAG: neutral zinc metallopeptidase [Pseudonocardiaceae bacterium]